MKHSDARRLMHVLHWAQESNEDPSLATADWLARDIDPATYSAVALLTKHDIPLDQLRQAKDVFKTMRLVGETAADRRMGGRLYLAAIAAAIVVHDTRISRQSTAAITRGLISMTQDRNVPAALRDLADRALGKVAARFNVGVNGPNALRQSPQQRMQAGDAGDSEPRVG